MKLALGIFFILRGKFRLGLFALYNLEYILLLQYRAAYWRANYTSFQDLPSFLSKNTHQKAENLALRLLLAAGMGFIDSSDM